MKCSWWISGGLGLILGALAGCGGGGGGSFSITKGFGQCAVVTAPGSLAYGTIWGSSPANASQVLQIIDGDGFVVRTDSLNRNAAFNSNLNLNAIPSGYHYVRATIYNGPNASGGVFKVTEFPLNLCAGGPGGTSASVTTTAASDPNSVGVSVSGLTVTEQAVIQYVATGYAGNNPAFVAPNAFSWAVIGGVGSVDANGKFTATAAGSGNIQAGLTSPLLAGAASVTVNPFTVTQSEWTVMVYMNAANDLYQFSDRDMNEIERIAGNANVRFVVQWKQTKQVWSGSSFDGVRRYLAKPDQTSNIVSELIQSNLTNGSGQPLDMGSPQTLNDFITWAKTNYPAKRYALVLWNHGNGWRRSVREQEPTRAFSYDDQSGNSIQTWQMGQALTGHHFDIIAWDSSLMQMIEVAYEGRNFADYFVGSEESPPGDGYPYHLAFANMVNTPFASTSDITKSFVDGMLAQYPAGQGFKITQSVLDSTKLSALATALDVLGTELQIHGPAMPGVIQTVRANAQSYSPTFSRVYRDIVDVCLRLEAEPSVPGSVKAACANVRVAVANAVVWEGHNSNSPGSHGISIDFSSAGTFSGGTAFDYARLKFAQDTSWNEWLSIAP
ncbi:clostripain-related cysteine peptidase [Kamptonema cortianum]|nr:clostripain-related cysteine peptidase [Geitlerinema splendidum]MDK3161072.1 clostripain-related cysteine peptidase [Kamptonema cortianum]